MNENFLKKTTVVIILVFFALSLPSHAQSQCLTEVDGTASIGNATTGTDVVISVSTAGSDCTVSTLVLESDPNTLTISDPPSGQYSSFSAGATKTFTVTAGTEGAYTITARGTTDAGSVSDSTPVIIEFVYPSSLIVEGSPSTTTVRHLDSVTISVNITNNQDSDITTSYTFTEPSRFDYVAGDSTSGTVTVAANSATSRSWTITHDECTTLTKTATFDLGDSDNVFTTTITTNVTCGETPSNTTSGSTTSTSTTTTNTTTTNTTTTTTNTTTTNTTQNVTVVTTEQKATVTIAEITANTSTEVVIEKSEEVGVRRLTINAKNTIQNVEITITKLAEKPPEIAVPSGMVFAYIEINATNINQTDLNSVLVDFDVNRTWVNESNIDENTIALLRYTDNWAPLKTTKTGETDTKLLFQAESPGFSSFAITGHEKLDPMLFAYALVVIIILIAAFIIIKKKPNVRKYLPKKRTSKKEKPKSRNTDTGKQKRKYTFKPSARPAF